MLNLEFGISKKDSDDKSIVVKRGLIEAQNKELKKKLEEIKSPRFIEQQARDKLGLSKKGETIVVIPQEKKLNSYPDYQTGKGG